MATNETIFYTYSILEEKKTIVCCSVISDVVAN